MPGVTLDLAQTVAIGPFNPHIVTPGWLTQQQVCDVSEFEGYVLPSSGGRRRAFRFGNLEWEVDSRRLSVSLVNSATNRPSVDPGERVRAVVEKLNHTPVRTVGHNFHFSCDLSDWDKSNRPSPRLGDRATWEKPEGAEAMRASWSAGYLFGDIQTEVTLETSVAGYAVLLFNHQRETGPRSSGEAEREAGRFAERYELTRTLCTQLFGLTLS